MKRFIHAVGLAVVMLGLWHGRPGLAAEARVALVIGNSGYKFAPPLANPANDARLMAETLRGLGFEVIEPIDADRETILLATFELQDRLIAAGKDAVGLFFYAGHGVQVAGENYFIPLGTEIDQEREISVKAVSASFVLKQMEFADNRMNFVILDACRNNPFPASTRATTRGLARMDAPRGSLVAYSTGPGEVAADGIGDNSPYVLALSEAMKVPGVPAELMFKRVRESVLAATNDTQTPWEESSLKGANFYFTGDVSITVEAPATPAAPATSDSAATTQQETAFWQTIQNSTDPAMFEEYLRQFPTGIFAGLARIKRDGLQKDAAPEAAPETTAEAPIPAEPETSEEIETALLAPPLIPGTTGVGSIERFECSGPGAKTYVFRVVSVDGDTIRLDYTVDGEQRWVEKPIAYLGVNLFTRKERNDGNGIRYQRFDDDDFRGLAQLLPGSTFGAP